MIFVTLGTQDKEFKRLLEMVDNAIEKGVIKDKVIAQIGITKYTTNNMELFDYTTNEEMLNYIEKADYIITHGGVGTIFNCLKKGKKVIVVPRLAKYGEHHNDHQLQVVEEFTKKGYILDGSNLEEAITKIETFMPNKYQSNNDNFITNLIDYIDKN